MVELNPRIKVTELNDIVNGKVVAIVVCGGSSSRMKGVDKMFAPIFGVPVAVRSVLKFQNSPVIDGIIIVTREEKVLEVQKLCEEYKLTKVTDIVVGGRCRQESVYNGLKMVSDDTAFVLIHDGARPFVTLGCIERVLNGAKRFHAVAAAVPLKDTVKQIKGKGDLTVVGTPDRSTLASVQTPQGFRTEIYKAAVEAFYDRLEDFTDDCSIVEAYGQSVSLVDGDYRNIKITTAEDLAIAEILAEGEEQ